MKRKIFSILFALVLVLSFSLVAAVPAGAAAGVVISSTNVEGPYVAGAEQEFSITTTSDVTYQSVLFRFVVEGAVLADITSFEFYYPLESPYLPDTWASVPLTQDGSNVKGYFGPETGFPMVGSPETLYNETTLFNVNFNTPKTYPVTVSLVDVSGEEETVITTANFSVVVAQTYTTDYTGAITKTADRLVALQSSTDYGWDWIVTDLTEHSGNTADNLYGVTALGLIDTYEVTEDTAYKTAAEKTADHLKTLSRATDSDVRIMSFDYRFLVEFSALSQDNSYKTHALNEWNWVKAEVPFFYADGNQEQFYQWYIDTAKVSPGYAAWQTADAGLAALAMEDTSWASNMAAVLAGHLTEITGTDDWRFIGWAKTLEFLNAVDSSAYATEIGTLITNLTGSQSGGSWVGTAEQGTVQNTAYAVMGLAVAGGVDAITAAEAGANWLVANQITNGGWTETDGVEYSEVDSEALQAIKAVLDISGSVSMIAAYIPQIGISVTPLSVDFGSVVPGVASASHTVTVTNTGNVAEAFSASIENESPPGVYTTGLETGGNPVAHWVQPNVQVNSFVEPPLILRVPLATPPGTYTATLVFWAEQARP